MSGTVPPIPPPFGASSGNPGSPNVNRVDTMPTTTDPINTTTTTNVAQSVTDENLLQLLDSRGGSHVTNVPAFNKEDFTSWKVSLSTTENPLPKRQNQWSNSESRLANQDKRLKSIIISCLPNNVMKFVIKYKTAKEIWNDLILAHEGPYATRDSLLNDIEIMVANNSIKNDSLATLYGKYNYEEGLIDQIYESEIQRFSIQASSSKALISNTPFQDSDSDVEEDQRTNNEFIADLNIEYHERALLANLKRFYKRSGMDKEFVSSWDEGTTRIRAFMAIAEDEPSVGKADARSGSEKNMVNKYNLLKQELSLHKSELSNLKNNVSINCSLQNEVIRVNLENESLNDEIFDLKRVIEKWTCSKVTHDQLLSEQIPGNIVKALGGKGMRKKNNPSKEVLFTKSDVSTSESTPMITSDSKDGSDI
ncbi:hypothetical protein Tco_0002007 [Tanacetum coccineum]